jgi:hypothetical protein
MHLRSSINDLPQLDELPSTPTSVPQGAGKRQWESGKVGYERWAVAQLLSKSRVLEGDRSGVIGIAEQAKDVGATDDLKAAVAGHAGIDHGPDESMEANSLDASSH